MTCMFSVCCSHMGNLIPIQLKLPADVLDELNAVCRSGERTRFIVDAIRGKLDGKAGGYEAGHRAGYEAGYGRGFESMLDRSMIDRDCYHDALQLVHDGMDVASALRQAYEENPKMRSYRVKLGDLPGDAEEGDS